jgi:predicted PhzF superfamily epimerase YddE/YHI9
MRNLTISVLICGNLVGVSDVSSTFGHRLWWVDSFIGDAARGNPAAVVLLERPLPDADLQHIAFELGVGETAFLRRVNDQWSLRWFTPTVEVDVSGHATLAALHVALTELLVPPSEVFFQTRAGNLSGRRVDHNILGIDLPRQAIEEVEPLTLESVSVSFTQCFRAGANNILAVVPDYDTLCGLQPDPMSLLLAPGSMLIAVCEGAPGADVGMRVFAPRLGVPEDAATGSAAAAVAPWWVDRSGSPTLSIRQASPRGGLMFARTFKRNVEVAGEARTFLDGYLRI